MSVLYDQIGRATDVVARLAANDVQLPVSPDPDYFGVIQDAQGREVMSIDVNAERPEDQVAAIIETLVALINASGGFPAEKTATDDDAGDVSDGPMEPILTEHRARAILQSLKDMSSGKANEPLLRDLLKAYGLDCGRKKFRSACALLAHRGFVEVEEEGLVRVVVLTEAGADEPSRIGTIGRAAA